MVFIPWFLPKCQRKKASGENRGLFGASGGSAASSAGFFLFGGWWTSLAGDEGDEFGEVSIDVAETAIGVCEGFGDLQEDARVAVLTGLCCGFEEATG